MNKNELLKYAMKNGIINVSYVEEQVLMIEKERLLEKHPYKIWCGTDEKWHTYLPDEQKGRIHKKRNSKEEIYDIVIQYWKKTEETHTLKTTFYEWVNEKLNYGEIEKSTYDRYETDFFRFFDDKFSNKDIRSVTENSLEEFIKTSIHDKQLSSKAYAGLRTLLNGIFKYGKKNGYTDISIHTFFGDLCLSRKIFYKKTKCAEKEVFTETEIKKIISHVNNNNPKIRELGILLAIYTGVRVGELSALKPMDINLKERTIHIQRSEARKKEDGKNVIYVKDFPKSDAGDRYLLLSDKAYNVAKKILEINAFGEYLFQDEHTGKRISENGFNHKLSRLCTAVKIPIRSMHKLRKTYGTTLIDSGVDESIIKEQMGHADIKTTRQYYYYSNHSREEKLKQINKACI